MNLTDSLKLLRDYADHGNEAAFRELVERYIGLVYSSAIRRVGGNAELARDVTQTVFTDLARKARSLRRVELLGGWLHRHTGFVAATAVRGEQRRQIREQEAAYMNALNDSPDVLWQQLAPVLDETIDALDQPDRQAILLRFFERRDFRSIGATLGISDDAAQKRVSRALEKLRQLLANRGITLSFVLLGTLMAGRVVRAVPTGLAAKVASLALVGAATSGGLMVIFSKVVNSLFFKMAAGTAAIALVAWLLLPGRSTPGQKSPPAETVAATLAKAGNVPAANPQAPMATAAGQAAEPNPAGKMLLLEIMTADGQQPVPDVKLDYWVWENGHVHHKKSLHANTFGVCEVPVPDDTAQMILVSEKEGFADTRLDWRPDHGETIPAEYTLRLKPAVPIGGQVVDPDGNPVSGAQVGFNNQPDPSLETRPQSDNFGWPFGITATTDAQGRWQIDRISKEALRSIYGGATHPDYVGSALVFSASNPEVETQLLAGTEVFTLGRTVTVRGIVEDPSGQSVPDAKVLVGELDESGSRETTNRADGTFVVTECAPGNNDITAQADGYAPTTQRVSLTNNTPPIHIILRPGKLLELQVVDASGNPVPKASVWLNNFDYAYGPVDPNHKEPPPVQVDFHRQTDANGLLIWTNAPDQELAFQVTAAGYMESGFVKMRPDGTKHVITLQSALTISGTVRDATTGRPIPRFHIVTGWPVGDVNSKTKIAHWSTLGRFWLSFGGGKFQHTFEEPVIAGTKPTYIFKFEADGYAPFVTRMVSATERNVRFDVALNPASATQVTVLMPDAEPASWVSIGLVSPGASLNLGPSGFSRYDLQSAGGLLLTDRQGHFQLPADPSITQVVAATAKGYAEATPAELAAEPVMYLEPWGRLEGTYLYDGQPVVGATLGFQFAQKNQEAIFCDFHATTDREGRFVFAQVPLGVHDLSISDPGKAMGHWVWSHKPLQQVTIRSGETTAITLGGSNAMPAFLLPLPGETTTITIGGSHQDRH